MGEQSGVADRRDADDRLRGVSYITSQKISTKSEKNIHTKRFASLFEKAQSLHGILM